MVCNEQLYQRLTVKQSFDSENSLLDSSSVINLVYK